MAAKLAIRIIPLALAGLLALAPVVHAQDAASREPARIERQMTAEQFRAAGLDRLTPEQLAQLNAWLNRTLVVEADRAAASAEKRVKDENRGLGPGASEPIESRISGEFRGFDKGRDYALDNGQVWQQTDTASLAGVRLDQPRVRITPGRFGNVWYLSVEGYNTRAKVQRIK